jgi:hypothetical protein
VLSTWVNGAWIMLGTNSVGIPPSFPSDGSSLIPWSSPVGTALSYVTAGDRMVSLQCRPVAFPGPGIGTATTVVDYIELRVDYQAPDL